MSTPSSLDPNRLPVIDHTPADSPDADTTITAGDRDVDIAGAATVGDEAPGGDNPTPDQDIVDEIGLAMGVNYQDNQELQGGAELEERDRHRWELDPASAEDFKDRSRDES